MRLKCTIVNKFYGFCMAVISHLILLKTILYWNDGLEDLSGVLSAGENPHF